MPRAARPPKPLLVGEAPSRRSDPAVPFSARSGDRLRELLGCPLEDVFDVRNLLDSWPGSGGKGSLWPRAEAREAALAILDEWKLGQTLVLAGRRVGEAFALDYPYFEVIGERYPSVVIPHPSGVNRWWNDAKNVEFARRFLRSLA